MQLNFAFLANSAEVADGRFLVLGGGIDGVTADTLPGILPSLSMVASIHFSEDECGPLSAFTNDDFQPCRSPKSPVLRSGGLYA